MNERNIHYHEKTVKVQEKSEKNGHQPCVVWLTGLSGSGKSTIANALERELFSLGCQTHVLDGDNVRFGLNNDLGFSKEDRKENIRRIGEVANLFAESGSIIITAFISPYLEDRELARKASKHKFLEVYVKTDIEICEERDPKGLYKLVREGKIKGFTGIDAPYEEPVGSLVVNAGDSSLSECVTKIIDELKKLGII
jgi:adenylylsulfate kinase